MARNRRFKRNASEEQLMEEKKVEEVIEAEEVKEEEEVKEAKEVKEAEEAKEVKHELHKEVIEPFNNGNCFLVRKNKETCMCLTCDREVGFEEYKQGRPFNPDTGTKCNNPKNKNEVIDELDVKVASLHTSLNKYMNHLVDVIKKNKSPSNEELIEERVSVCEGMEGVCYKKGTCLECRCPVNRSNPLIFRNKAGWEQETCPKELWIR